MYTYLFTGIYFEYIKKKITQGLSVIKNKGKQSISNGINAMEEYFPGCFPQAVGILNVIELMFFF